MKKGLAFRNQKREKAGKLKVKKRKRERRFRGVWGFLVFFFIFCLRHYRERVITGEWGFLFVKQGESTVRERLSLKVRLHLGRERLGCRRPPWSFFLPYTCICIFIYSDFMNDERCV